MQAVVFDVNGTLSDDEPVLARVYQELLPELSVDEYYARYAGHTDEYIFGGDERLIAERVRRYVELCSDGSTVDEGTRAAVRFAAERIPVGLVSAALREEIDPVLGAAGLLGLFRIVVAQDDVTRGKPDPQPYLLAAERLQVDPGELVVFEDTEVGVASAPSVRAADELVERIDVGVLERLLCS